MARRQRPLDLRSSWKCQGRASAWLRTLVEGMRMPRVRCEASWAWEMAAVVVDVDDETAVLEPCLATRREEP